MFSFWRIAGERQAAKCRKEYFKSILSQELAWFDIQNQAKIVSVFNGDSTKYQEAIGEKISNLIMITSMFIFGLAVSFYVGWIVTLVILAYLPIIILLWTKNVAVKA